MEISGYPHYENVCSNILKFYLDINNEHELKDLIINSVVHCADKDFHLEYEFENIEVLREVETNNGNRLDILIKTNNYIIGIENKFFITYTTTLKIIIKQ
nr:PD-(D/E)XK nuclease family protein [Rufibacter sp. XAAS-G3-1]